LEFFFDLLAVIGNFAHEGHDRRQNFVQFRALAQVFLGDLQCGFFLLGQGIAVVQMTAMVSEPAWRY